MANLAKIKRKNSLGAPPSLEEASQNLTAPEIVPVASASAITSPRPRVGESRIDGRSLRKTGRTVQFATKVSPEYDEKFRSIAARDSLVFGDLLEKSLAAYEAARK